MILKFCAKDDQLVVVPGTAQYAGQVARYVNRECKVDKDDAGAEVISWPATAEPYAVEAGSTDGRRLAKLTQRDGALLPFDKATADAIGVAFVPIKFTAGVWVTTPAAPKKGDS